MKRAPTTAAAATALIAGITTPAHAETVDGCTEGYFCTYTKVADFADAIVSQSFPTFTSGGGSGTGGFVTRD